MTDYSNILSALGKSNTLTPQQVSDNLDAYKKLTDNGVYIPELLQKMKQLEERIDNIEKPKENVIDAELFAVMEQAVKDDPLVMDAKRRLQNEKTRVISELCMKSEDYRKCFDEFRRVVNQCYVSQKEQTSPGE